MDQATQSKLVEIARHYGLDNQLNQTIEECSELIKECSKSIRYGKATEGIVEEIADVFVMLNQIAFLLSVPKSTLEKIISEKLDRQIGRILQEKD